MYSVYDDKNVVVFQSEHLSKVAAYLQCYPKLVKEKVNNGKFVNPFDGRTYSIVNKKDYTEEKERVLKYLASEMYRYKTITDLPVKEIKALLTENNIKAKITKNGRTYLVEANG